MLFLLSSPFSCFLWFNSAAFCAGLKLDTTSKSTATCHKFTARSSSVTSAQVIPSDISRQTERRRHPIKVESEKRKSTNNKKKMQQNSCPITKEKPINELGLKVKRGSCTTNDEEREGCVKGGWTGDRGPLQFADIYEVPISDMEFMRYWNFGSFSNSISLSVWDVGSQITSLWSRVEKRRSLLMPPDTCCQV